MASCHGCTVSRASGQQWVKRATFFGTEPMLKVVKIVNFRGHSFKIMDEGNNSFFLVMIEFNIECYCWLLLIIDGKLTSAKGVLIGSCLILISYLWHHLFSRNLFEKKIEIIYSLKKLKLPLVRWWRSELGSFLK